MSICSDVEEVIWVDIPGTSGNYQISNKGTIRSFKREKPVILKAHIVHDRKTNEHPLERVYLWVDGKKQVPTVQRLLAICFIGPPPDDSYVARLKDPSKPVTVDNIEWAKAVNLRRSTSCPQGHSYYPDNFYEKIFNKSGELRCRICHREQANAYARRRNGWKKKNSDSKIE